MTVRRALLVVLDGLGIGAMDDALPRDAGANTLRSVAAATGGLDIPNLAGLGLAEIAGVPGIRAGVSLPRGAAGAARLGYAGADTYLGHQAMMGAPLQAIELHMLADRDEAIRSRLVEAGRKVERLRPDASPLLVDGVAVVADNIEAAPGLNINVTASCDEIEFDALVEIGRLVRSVVAVPRIIVVGGRGYTTSDVVRSITVRAPGHVGVDTPALGVYDANYQVRHLGGAAASDATLPVLLVRAGRPVVLLGKAADVVECPGAERSNDIRTVDVLTRARDALTDAFDGLIVANVQETDLAGHEQDAARFRRVLEEVDRGLPALVAALGPEGMLLVSADHGNDPTVGHSQHTRELVPILACGPGVPRVDLGVRESLGDVGATIAALLGVGPLLEGRSFGAMLCAGARSGEKM